MRHASSGAPRPFAQLSGNTPERDRAAALRKGHQLVDGEDVERCQDCGHDAEHHPVYVTDIWPCDLSGCLCLSFLAHPRAPKYMRDLAGSGTQLRKAKAR